MTGIFLQVLRMRDEFFTTFQDDAFMSLNDISSDNSVANIFTHVKEFVVVITHIFLPHFLV